MAQFVRIVVMSQHMRTQRTRKGTFNTAFQERLSSELLDALNKVGGVHKLAKACSVAFPTIYDWLCGRTTPSSEAFGRVEQYLLAQTGILLSSELDSDRQLEPLLAPICEVRGSYQIEDTLIRSLDVQLALRRMVKHGQGHLAEVLAKRHLMKMPLAEIGQEQGISYQAVGRREYRARVILRNLLVAHAPPGPKKDHRSERIL